MSFICFPNEFWIVTLLSCKWEGGSKLGGSHIDKSILMRCRFPDFFLIKAMISWLITENRKLCCGCASKLLDPDKLWLCISNYLNNPNCRKTFQQRTGLSNRSLNTAKRPDRDSRCHNWNISYLLHSHFELLIGNFPLRRRFCLGWILFCCCVLQVHILTLFCLFLIENCLLT